jgi:exopolysaccharide biosynthesis predicted pyruvyltransferase EpsI
MEKTNIVDYLANYKNETIIFVPNPGNAGDSLIAYAAYQLFDTLGIHYELGRLDSVYKGRIVFYGGGGNLVEPYQNAVNFIQANHRQVKKLVILPHTIRAYPNLLAELGSNVDIFCREFESLAFVKSHIKQSNLYHSDDLAFHTDVKLLFQSGLKLFPNFNAVSALTYRNLKRTFRVFYYNFKNSLNREQLNAFRYDVEKTAQKIPYANIDLSQVYATDTMSYLYAHEACFRLLEFINHFSIVHTNRLHISIAALLLRKNVFFYPNSYNKNESVYRYSIENRYSNVIWVCDDQ